jgi:hypothetical protein
VLVFVVLSLFALAGIAAWATETGRAWQVKSQLQAIADAASLAGAGNLLSNDFQTVDPGAAIAAATSYGPLHKVLSSPLTIDAADVAAGSWDLATGTFTPLPGSTDPDVVRAVRVRTRRDGNANGPVPTILGRALGVASVNVNSEAVAYWGFAGSAGPGTVDLPMALDCCAISGNSPGSVCTQNYCDTISSTTPNPCPLSGGGGPVTCLEFHSSPEQNACWTQFDGEQAAISTPDLVDIVESSNANEISGDVYVDNGDKVPVIREIRDRFEGRGQYIPGEGVDTNGDGVLEWVITLPVLECQNPGDQCATGNTQAVVGFVCFEINEVLVTPAKIIKGRFLCPTDPRCDSTGLGPGGTVPGALSAQFPVIVD